MLYTLFLILAFFVIFAIVGGVGAFVLTFLGWRREISEEQAAVIRRSR